jgi:DNA-binding Lrp family transcriptional regulator
MTGLIKLDRIDIKILSQLQQNGRLTNVNLAEARSRIWRPSWASAALSVIGGVSSRPC